MRHHPRGQEGQITIFYSTTILVIITFIAFVVNIGIFVKAKINLQNAVDAAAWSGAAVQARQLTNIGYLNWEMRNIYKEWMFKYYILGNMSLDTISQGSGGNVRFNMESIPGQPQVDSYNFPSVCVNFSTTTPASNAINICKTYSIPGLPRFESNDSFGIDETTTAFINTIVQEKAAACSESSQLNFLTANLWAYNVDQADNQIAQIAPEIASNRWGAFPKAFELAMRMRNLEYQVNLPPYSRGVCMAPGEAAGNCNNAIQSVLSTRLIANERIAKAFYAGYRNLGNETDNELKRSFTLTEIPPRPYEPSAEFSLSRLLIPPGSPAVSKHYLDLKLITLNLATFYTAFTAARSQNISTTEGSVRSEGQCDATKTALPVPGYPIGFVKNPNVLTYYAVKGEANFVGLFNPFDFQGNGIKITAYAAAKPFGGRIGPMLANLRQDDTLVYARGSGDDKFLTSAYLLGINTANLLDNQGNTPQSGDQQFIPGAPLPATADFWLSSIDEPIGGWTQAESLRFAIPNIPFDFPGNDLRDRSFISQLKLDLIDPSSNNSFTSGAFHPDIFAKLRASMTDVTGGAISGVITPAVIEESIMNARRPTLYDAYNYLIPTPEEANAQYGVDSFGPITKRGETNNSYFVEMYAPLLDEGQNSLYSSAGDLESVLRSYLGVQEKAVEEYVKAMSAAASSMRRIETVSGARANAKAADVISDADPETGAALSCNSMAGAFAYFYTGNASLVGSTAGCPKALPTLMVEYWSANRDEIGKWYKLDYKRPSPSIEASIYSAYMPGPLHDATEDGTFTRAIGASVQEVMKRNFYSTKLVTLKSLFSSSRSYHPGSNFSIFSEGNIQNSEVFDTQASELHNYLNAQQIGVDLSNINY